jgi:predicted nucleic acid-binding protein
MSFTPAVLDANVLVPPVLRDALLSAAEAGLFRPHWSAAILDEIARTLRRLSRSAMTEAGTRRLITQMELTFPDASVRGYEPLIDAMTNDPDDRHVLAAAVAAGARVIVTFNLRHFGPESLLPFQIEAQHPDAFLSGLIERDAEAMVRVVEDQAARLRNPPRSVEEVFDSLARFAPAFAGLMRAARESRT